MPLKDDFYYLQLPKRIFITYNFQSNSFNQEAEEVRRVHGPSPELCFSWEQLDGQQFRTG